MTLNPNPAPVSCDNCGTELLPQEKRGQPPTHRLCTHCRLDEIALRHRETTTAYPEIE